MRKYNKRTISILCAIAAFGIGSSTEAWANKGKTTSVQGLSETELQSRAYDRSAVISFDQGSNALSEMNKTAIRDLVVKVGSENISRIEVVSWSDKDFPRTGSDLPKADRDLADQRAKHVKDFITDSLGISGLKVSTYNMAETSNWLARTFRTDDAELKSVFAKQATVPMARTDFNIVFREGAPSKTIVVIVQK